MSMLESLEQQAALMDNLFADWLDACENMRKFPDLKAAREKARAAYQAFLIEREKYMELLRAVRKAVSRLRMNNQDF